LSAPRKSFEESHSLFNLAQPVAGLFRDPETATFPGGSNQRGLKIKIHKSKIKNPGPGGPCAFILLMLSSSRFI
jgi:hypothetical protein